MNELPPICIGGRGLCIKCGYIMKKVCYNCGKISFIKSRDDFTSHGICPVCAIAYELDQFKINESEKMKDLDVRDAVKEYLKNVDLSAKWLPNDGTEYKPLGLDISDDVRAYAEALIKEMICDRESEIKASEGILGIKK